MPSASNKPDDQLISEHLDFFTKNASGCAFAAHAARDAQHFGWGLTIIRRHELADIDSRLQVLIEDPNTSTLSVLFPDVQTDDELDALLPAINGKVLFLHEKLDTLTNRCYRYRAHIHGEVSYVSGFGPFSYMPVTRRTLITALVIRVAARPVYDWHLKEPTPGILHVADMDMKGMPDRTLKRMWNNSFLRTAGLLGHKPDEESAAKTTFVVPIDRAQQISL